MEADAVRGQRYVLAPGVVRSWLLAFESHSVSVEPVGWLAVAFTSTTSCVHAFYVREPPQAPYRALSASAKGLEGASRGPCSIAPDSGRVRQAQAPCG